MQNHLSLKVGRGVIVFAKIFSVVLLTFIVLVILAWVFLDSKSAPPFWALLGLTAFCVYCLLFEKVNRWRWGRRFSKRAADDLEIEWEFSNDQVKVRSSLGSSTLSWRVFARVVETSEGFLFFYSNLGVFNWIPLSAFESADCVERVRSFIRGSGTAFVQRV